MDKNNRLICLLLALVLLLSALPCVSFSVLAESSGEEFTIYEENFDNVTGKVELAVGENSSDSTGGWIYSKNSADGNAYLQDGKMYFSGSAYDVVYRDGGQNWGNYILEADFCYTNENVGWGGMLYNVQSPKKFQKVGITIAGRASANGYNNGWTNDSDTLNKTDMIAAGYTVPDKGTPFRMKVVVENKTASFYYAMLNESGSLTSEYVLLKTISNIPADAQTGSIGFMTSSGSLGSFWVDNIKCYSYSTVSYFENFDSYTDVSLKGDSENTDIGLYYEKNFTDGKAYIEGGKLYISGGGKNFDAVFFTMGENWTNYAVEADITYTVTETGWAGLLYRSTDINNFQKGAVSAAKRKCLNGQKDGSWFNDKEGVTKLDYAESKVQVNVTSRLRIEAEENSARLYIAYYDAASGTLGDWNFVMEIKDNFADVHMSGTVGFIVGGSNNSKTSAICVDNLTVHRGTNRMSEVKGPANAAVIYEPESGIVNPPVVIQKLTDKLPNTSGERAAVVMAEVDSDMNILGDGGKVLVGASEFIDTYRTLLIPAFVIDSEAEAKALASLIEEKNLIDCYVMADSANAALVRTVRLANSTTAQISGALIFDDLNDDAARKNARAVAVDNMCYVVISKTLMSEESSKYFNVRQIAAWSFVDDDGGVYRGIANGYHGIVCKNVEMIYDVYESITEPTVSGKPIIIAHRGANKAVGYPENTIMGYKAAIEKYGADAIEVDLRLTKDGYVYLMHDSTVDRTTNGTGSGASFTLEAMKSLSVDEISGKQTVVPTFEELLELIKGTDTVIYCHMNIRTDAAVAAFSHLVDKYDCRDNVMFFCSYASRSDYNSNTDRLFSGGAYKLNKKAVMTDGILFTSGDAEILGVCRDIADGVVAMKSNLTPYNYQALFYKYANQGALWASESFYYNLSARGFVNTHSITDTQSVMDTVALTGSGAVGYLTDDIDLCDDYHYAIIAEKAELGAGEVFDLNKQIKTTVGTVDAKCGYIQLSGTKLTETEGGVTLNESGSVTVVLYADRKADGGSTYRIYSEPIELTFVLEAEESSESDETETAPQAEVPAEITQADSTTDENNENNKNNKNNNGTVVIILISAVAAVIVGAAAIIVIKRRR